MKTSPETRYELQFKKDGEWETSLRYTDNLRGRAIKTAKKRENEHEDKDYRVWDKKREKAIYPNLLSD